jgi:hypothetical protein
MQKYKENEIKIQFNKACIVIAKRSIPYNKNYHNCCCDLSRMDVGNIFARRKGPPFTKT